MTTFSPFFTPLSLMVVEVTSPHLKPEGHSEFKDRR